MSCKFVLIIVEIIKWPIRLLNQIICFIACPGDEALCHAGRDRQISGGKCLLRLFQWNSAGRLVSETQTACVVMRCFNLAKPEYRKRILKYAGDESIPLR